MWVTTCCGVVAMYWVGWMMTLPTIEMGVPFLQKRIDPFSIILCKRRFLLILIFKNQLLFPGIGESVIQGVFGIGQSLRGHLGKGQRQLFAFFFEAAVGVNGIDHPHFFCCMCRDLIAGHHDRGGFLPADQTGERKGSAAVGDEADLTKGLDKGSGFGGNHDIAAKGDVGTGTGGDTVYRGDHRLGYISDPFYNGIVMFGKDLFDPDFIVTYQFADVLAGSKGLPRACDVYSPHFMQGGRFIQPGLHLQGHLAVKGIELIGAVEGDVSNTVADLKKDGGHNKKIRN